MSEDLKPSGDITTRLIKGNKKIKAKIISNQNCVIGGLSFAKEAFKYSDKKVIFKLNTKDGRKISKGRVVATVYGKVRGILKSERVALNFLSLISGVATTTKKFVDKVKGESYQSVQIIARHVISRITGFPKAFPHSFGISFIRIHYFVIIQML